MKKLTHEEFVKRIDELYDSKYKVLGTYVNNTTKIDILCPDHGVWKCTPVHFMKNHQCPKCSKVYKYTTEEFIEKCKSMYSSKNYDYSLVEYVSSHTKVTLICPIHGEFKIKPNCLFNGSYCPKCSSIATKNNKKEKLDKITKDLKVKFKNIYGDLYDYSKFIYINKRTKIVVICKEHGEFLCTIKSHLKGFGCIKCNKLKSDVKRIKRYKRKTSGSQQNHKNLTLEDRISLFSEIHKNKYDYSKFEYTGFDKHIIVICPIHGEFKVTYNMHMKGRRCRKCSDFDKRYTTDEFIDVVSKLHNFKYDYSQFKYDGYTTKTTIICPAHGPFQQSPKDHQSLFGCPICNSSKGEIRIKIYLMKNGYIFEPQYKIPECKNILPLPFDFGVLNEDGSLSCLIEMQGRQHFECVRFGGSWEEAKINFENTKRNDKLKKDYCEKNGIKILYINYKELNNIEEILKEYFQNEFKNDLIEPF